MVALDPCFRVVLESGLNKRVGENTTTSNASGIGRGVKEIELVLSTWTKLHRNAILGNGIDDIQSVEVKSLPCDFYGRTCLHYAVELGNEAFVRHLLLRKGVDPNQKESFQEGDNCRGFTPLHIASKNGDIGMVEVLLESKLLNLNMQSNSAGGFFAMSPLHLACLLKKYEVVKVLLKAGADLDKVDALGRTPLHCLTTGVSFHATNRAVDVLRSMLKNKNCSKLDAKDCNGRTFLHNIAASGNSILLDPVFALKRLKQEELVNTTDDIGYTCLHCAINGSLYGFSKPKSVVRVLLENGANVGAKDKKGRTAIDLAKKMLDFKCWGKTEAISIQLDIRWLERAKKQKADAAQAMEELILAEESSPKPSPSSKSRKKRSGSKSKRK